MLALARAVATSPRLLMLDELSMGLAPIVVDELYDHVVQLATDGITVVVVEQFARTALRVATSAIVMANGRVVQTGAAGDVRIGAPFRLPGTRATRTGLTGEQRGVRSRRRRNGNCLELRRPPVAPTSAVVVPTAATARRAEVQERGPSVPRMETKDTISPG